jgi:ParB-like chromosome segregation protein Spo0J
MTEPTSVHQPLPLAKLPGTDINMPGELVPLLVPIDSIRENPENPRIPEDVEHLAGLMRRFGYTDPVVVDRSGLLEAGHRRLDACRLLAATHIPCVVVHHDATTGLAFNLAHNRSNEVVARWDAEALPKLLARLNAEDQAAGLGWAKDDLAALLAKLEAPVPVVEESKELDPDDFGADKFAHTCPRCGFSFDEYPK